MWSRDVCTLLYLFNSGIASLEVPKIRDMTRLLPDRINMAVYELTRKEMVETFTSRPFNPEGFCFYSIRLTVKGQEVLTVGSP